MAGSVILNMAGYVTLNMAGSVILQIISATVCIGAPARSDTIYPRRENSPQQQKVQYKRHANLTSTV